MFCFSQIRTSELNERKELKMEHNLPIMEIFFQNPWNHDFHADAGKKIAWVFFFQINFWVSNSRGNLNNNLYFLLLGLGVDDAFVLTSEYLTHSREAKAKAGGVSSFSRGFAAFKGWICKLISAVAQGVKMYIGTSTFLF